MTKLLVLHSSATGDASVSKQLARELVDRLRATETDLVVTERDIGAEPLPHLTGETLQGFGSPEPASEAARQARALSETLIAELKDADIVVIGAPMYNFGIASTLKTWFDYVLRAGITFRYTAEGPEGLVTGKRAVVIETRGGLYSEGPAQVMDAQEPHLRAMLGFIGVTDVTFVRAERLAVGPEARAAAITAALEELQGVGETVLARAA